MFRYSTAGVVLVGSFVPCPVIKICFSACCGLKMTHLEDYILMYKLYDLGCFDVIQNQVVFITFPVLLQFSLYAGSHCKYLSKNCLQKFCFTSSSFHTDIRNNGGQEVLFHKFPHPLLTHDVDKFHSQKQVNYNSIKAQWQR